MSIDKLKKFFNRFITGEWDEHHYVMAVIGEYCEWLEPTKREEIDKEIHQALAAHVMGDISDREMGITITYALLRIRGDIDG